AASFLPWGAGPLGPALRAGSYASLASPWRGVRAALSLVAGEPAAGTAIKAGAVVLALAVAALFARPLAALARVDAGVLPVAAVGAVVIAWLVAWPYVLPW